MEARELRNRLFNMIAEEDDWVGDLLHDEFSGDPSIEYITPSGDRFTIVVMKAVPKRGEDVSATKETL